MKKIEVKKGDRFGRLTIIEEVEPILRKKYKERRALCQCDCGTIKVISLYPLIAGKIHSCGCYLKEYAKANGKRFLKYAKDRTTIKLHSIWHGMKCRCYTASSGNYDRYGAKGVRVCKEWLDDFMSFYNWAISNGYSEELTIDRIDSNGNYEPSNCRWVNNTAQANNRKSNVLITYNGETHTITEWSKILNIKKEVLFSRRHNGWSIERMFSTPIKKGIK